MIPIRTLTIALAVILANPAQAGAPETHKAITQVTSWLNTSRALTNEDLSGRVILLDFWTYCCINCMHVIPDLKKLENEFGQDLTVIGVHSAKFDNEKDTDNIRSAILRYEVEHPVVNDSEFKIWKALGVTSWPTLILIGPDGEIAHVYAGEGHYDDLRKNIKQLRGVGKGINRQPLPISLEKNKEQATTLKFPSKMAYAADKQLLFVTDSGHHRIIALNASGIAVNASGDSMQKPLTIAFTIGQNGKSGHHDGNFGDALFNQPQGLLYKDGILYIADTLNHVLKKADLRKKTVTTIAGTGAQGFDRDVESYPALETAMSSPWDLAFFPPGGSNAETITIAMAGIHQLWTFGLNNNKVTVLAGNGREAIDDGDYPNNSLSQPSGLSAFQGKLYFVDSETSSLRVLENGMLRTLIGTGLFDFGFKNGKKKAAQLQHPLALTADETGVMIADSYNHSIRKYDLKSGTLTTWVGSGKRGLLNEPAGITRVGANYVIADTNNHRLQVWNPSAKSLKVLAISQETLPARKPSKTESRPLAGFLPQLNKTAPVTLAPNGVEVDFALEPNWHLNDTAPSWLALFDVTGAKAKIVQEYSQADVLKTEIILPKLNPASRYRLQGTLYYCSSEKGSVCLIQSTDQFIEVSKSGATRLSIQLKRRK